MKPTADGGIFWTGYTYDTAGGVDYPTCTNVRRPNVAAGKLDANGDYVWAKFYCNAAIQPPVNCLSSDEKYLIVGPGVKDANNQYIIDMFVAGTDCQGNIQWQGQWGSSKGDGTATAIPTSDGGFLAVGGSYGSDGDTPYHYTSNPPNLQLTDIIVLKADSLHNKQWVTVIGSSKQDGSRHVFQVGDFYYVIANTDPGGVDHDFANTAPYGPGSTTCFFGEAG